MQTCQRRSFCVLVLEHANKHMDLSIKNVRFNFVYHLMILMTSRSDYLLISIIKLIHRFDISTERKSNLSNRWMTFANID